MLSLFRLHIATGLLLCIGFLPQVLAAETKRETLEEEIQHTLNLALQRSGRKTTATFENCRLEVTYVHAEACSIKFKLADSRVTVFLKEVKAIELEKKNNPNSLKFWFEESIRKKLTLRRSEQSQFQSVLDDGVLFQERFFYCDGSLAPSRPTSPNKSFFLFSDHPNLAEHLNEYNRKYCNPDAK
ncbi:MAG: hypothetical protein ABJK65_09345 [Kangiellaceae bacterium]